MRVSGLGWVGLGCFLTGWWWLSLGYIGYKLHGGLLRMWSGLVTEAVMDR